MPERTDSSLSCSRNDDAGHIGLVTRIAKGRGCIGPYPCGRGIPEFGGQDAACDCETAALEFKPVMGDGGPCMSCGGNDGYGPAPHHSPDCYFASWEDAAHAT